MQTKQTRFLKDSISHSTTAATLGALVWLLLTLLPVREAGGQGVVIFNNRIGGGAGVGLTLHVWGPSSTNPGLALIGLGSNDNPSGSTPFGSASGMALIGAGGSGGQCGYSTTLAQLLGAVGAGQPESALVPVGQTTTFRSGVGLGDVAIINDTLSAVPPYSTIIPADAPAATFEIVAWDNSSGSYPTWVQASPAWQSGQLAAGHNAPFTVTAIGGGINPAVNLNDNQGSANGMASFNLDFYCLTPTVADWKVTDLTTTTAAIWATVNPNGKPTAGWFEWGLGSYTNLTSVSDMGNGSGIQPMGASLIGLTPATTYWFRPTATNGCGQAWASTAYFTTLTPPTVVTLPASNITSSTALLNGTVNPNGSPTTAWFQWGTDTNYGGNGPFVDVGGGYGPVPIQFDADPFGAGTTFHFRAVASGASLVYGNDQSFTTPTLPPLSISTGRGCWDAASSCLSYGGACPAGTHILVLLESADPTAPLSSWTRVATNGSSPGAFNISPVGTAGPKYYRVKGE